MAVLTARLANCIYLIGNDATISCEERTLSWNFVHIVMLDQSKH